MPRHLLLSILFCLSAQLVSSQTRSDLQPLLSNPTYFFPELSGWHGGIQANAAYRNQWPGLPSSQVSYIANADAYIHRWHSAIGFSLDHQRAQNVSGFPYRRKEVNASDANVHFSPKFKLGKTTLMPAVSASYFQISADNSWNDPGSLVTQNVNKLTFGAGLGLVAHETFAVAHIDYVNQPDVSFYKNTEERIARKYRLLLGRNFQLNQWRITPSAMFTSDGEFYHASVSTSMQYRWGYAGARYVLGDAIGIAAGVEIAKRFRFSYGYEFTVSRLSTQTLGSHEIGMRMLFFKDRVKTRFLENLPII